MKKILSMLITVSALVFLPIAELSALAANGQDTGDKLVVVIDPGHGGENLGTIENNHLEKEMTMTTALSMYEELLRYEDVEVYLTHTDDIDMSLRERAKFAQKVNADFLFSIHYNASASHELFGSEVWVSSVAPYNAYGYQFGSEFLKDMKELGLVNRGVKTRIGDSGKDYYGVIRESVALGIPAVIIEHCHVDEIHDMDYCDTEEELKAFGVADATAVAKYFGLKSSELNVDYSDYQLAEVAFDALVPITLTDDTEPDVCMIEVKEADYNGCKLTLKVAAADYDSPILYYSYSLDGGATFSIREPWPETDTLTGVYRDTFTLTLDIPDATKPQVIVRAYNMFDLYTESNCYQSEQIFQVPVVTPEPTAEPPSITIVPVTPEEVPALSDEVITTMPDSGGNPLIFLVLAIVIVAVMTALCHGILYVRRKKKRQK